MIVDYLKLHFNHGVYNVDDLVLFGKVVLRDGIWLYVRKELIPVAFDLLGARCTRIDFAVDTTLCYTGEWDTMVVSNGTTYYIGSRRSERFYRVYDKAAESGFEGVWYRYELECKGRVARDAFWRIQNLLYDGVAYSDAIEQVGYSLDRRGILPKDGNYVLWNIYEKNKRRKNYNWDKIFKILSTDLFLLENFCEYLKKGVFTDGISNRGCNDNNASE